MGIFVYFGGDPKQNPNFAQSFLILLSHGGGGWGVGWRLAAAKALKP